mmetsp:Transcript_16992/g.34008  ORF Transcript_16992/g.34008 Transcript_16992/m.34008 type:complete len:109 (+) Transcript_16992:174-500(+)
MSSLFSSCHHTPSKWGIMKRNQKTIVTMKRGVMMRSRLETFAAAAAPFPDEMRRITIFVTMVSKGLSNSSESIQNPRSSTYCAEKVTDNIKVVATKIPEIRFTSILQI